MISYLYFITSRGLTKIICINFLSDKNVGSLQYVVYNNVCRVKAVCVICVWCVLGGICVCDVCVVYVEWKPCV